MMLFYKNKTWLYNFIQHITYFSTIYGFCMIYWIKILKLNAELTIQNESTMLREFGNLQKIKDHFPKWVISLDEMETNSFEGIKHIQLKKFLIEGLG